MYLEIQIRDFKMKTKSLISSDRQKPTFEWSSQSLAAQIMYVPGHSYFFYHNF